MTAGAFERAYQTLNPAQKKAVDTVEGPVLVIAGPGTGKTHILTLRIANILKVTDADPASILVLTFTDSAARTVRKRLAGLIGEETARKVGIYTFHTFAGEVIQKYPEAFPEFADRRLMGEVEQVLLWRHVLETQGVKRLGTPKSPFHYLKDLKNLEDEMRRECLTLPAYRVWLDEERVRIEADPTLKYVRGEKEGQLKPDGTKRLERLEKGYEAAELIEAYDREKDVRGVYGYTDVLRIAVDTLRTDEALRADLQEKYQYVLADEHQDANALQHALLDALAFDDHPNLFIVGDEKQAIFGFQGADTSHFQTFLTLYPKTEVIALTENYRSYQDILDLSHGLLTDLPSAAGGHIQLSASRGSGGHMHVLIAPDMLAERDMVATLVKEAIAEGVLPHEIALITMKNATADLFALHLRARGIPTLRAGNIDLEARPNIRYLLALMRALADENDVASLRESLLAPWWQPSFAERTALMTRYRDFELIDAITATVPELALILETLRKEAISMPPLSFFSRALAYSGARSYFLGQSAALEEDIPLVRELMMHIEGLVQRTPNATFREIVADLTKAREHEIGSIKTSLTQKEGSVTVITAHKAKGMEFERVFVTALNAREWEGRGKSALIPSPFDTVREHEEVIRLFYVALTRAKNELILSYAEAGGEGRELAPMSLLPTGLPILTVPTDPLPLLHTGIDAPALVRELTERYLTHDGLSPSAYNEYLLSPPTFFAKRVLKLREPETRAIAVGNAVHAAIAGYLRTHGKAEEERQVAAYAELTRSLARSLLPRGDAFDQLTRHARASLDTYLAQAPLSHTPVAIEESFSFTKTIEGKQLLLKGKVDAVFAGEGGECIVDFKTSSKLDKKEEYERQLAFYDFLLRENRHTTTSAMIIQVGEEDIKEVPIPLTDALRNELATTLEEVLTELLSGRWRAAKETSDYDALLEAFH